MNVQGVGRVSVGELGTWYDVPLLPNHHLLPPPAVLNDPIFMHFLLLFLIFKIHILLLVTRVVAVTIVIVSFGPSTPAVFTPALNNPASQEYQSLVVTVTTVVSKNHLSVMRQFRILIILNIEFDLIEKTELNLCFPDREQ